MKVYEIVKRKIREMLDIYNKIIEITSDSREKQIKIINNNKNSN